MAESFGENAWEMWEKAQDACFDYGKTRCRVALAVWALLIGPVVNHREAHQGTGRPAVAIQKKAPPLEKTVEALPMSRK